MRIFLATILLFFASNIFSQASTKDSVSISKTALLKVETVRELVKTLPDNTEPIVTEITFKSNNVLQVLTVKVNKLSEAEKSELRKADLNSKIYVEIKAKEIKTEKVLSYVYKIWVI